VNVNKTHSFSQIDEWEAIRITVKLNIVDGWQNVNSFEKTDICHDRFPWVVYNLNTKTKFWREYACIDQSGQKYNYR